MTLSEETRKRVEKATVRLTKKGGQGVIVPDGLILTAAHCIAASLEGDMVLGDFFLEEIEFGGQKIVAQVYVVEPVSDIAVLGTPDDQTFYKEAIAFDKALELIEPVEIRSEDLELFREIPAMVFTHTRLWLQASVQKCNESASTLAINTPAIDGGTSGGPVIDQEGRLFGIISMIGCTIGREDHIGQIPWPSRALPVWVVKRITR